MNTKTTIKLKRPYTFGNQTYEEVTMREPTVKDQLAIAEMKASDAQREIAIFANLCELAPAFFHDLPIADLRKLQKAYTDFCE